MAIDFDEANWLQDSVKVMHFAQQKSIPCYLERSKSGNGGHLWFFFETTVPAFKSRQLAKHLISEAGLYDNENSFDRIFPNQDEHTGKGFGNLIALPLNMMYLQKGNTVFIQKNGEIIPDQWQYLASVQKIGVSKIEQVLEEVVLTLPEKPELQKQLETKADSVPEEPEVKTTQGAEVRMVLESSIYIPEAFLPDKLYKFLKERLIFHNPQFYEMERRGYSTWNTPRLISTLKKAEEGIHVPAGFLPKIGIFATQKSIGLKIADQRVICPEIDFSSKIELRKLQHKAVGKLLENDRAILEAKPGFGKTIVAIFCIKKRKQPTLIIVHTKELLHQWQKRLEEFFDLKKGDVGLIGDNKWEIGNKITIASYQTLARNGCDELRDKFGFVVIDECHHVPAKTFTEVVSSLPAKYFLGLTATAIRKDKLERLMHFYIGPMIRAEYEDMADENGSADEQSVATTIIVHKTDFQQKKFEHFHELGEFLMKNDQRNGQIINDLVPILQSGGKCLLLTERVEHCQILLDLVRKNIKGIHAAVAEGKMTKNERKRISKRILQDRFQLLIATGKLIGEGFDWPEVSYLFLAYPFSWKGKLIQYIGRVQRIADGKTQAFIHDYVDEKVNMLNLMYFKRLRTYRQLGLLKSRISSKKETVDENQLSIFS